MLHFITGKVAFLSFLRHKFFNDSIIISGRAIETLIEINPPFDDNEVFILQKDYDLFPTRLNHLQVISSGDFVTLTLKLKACRTWSDE